RAAAVAAAIEAVLVGVHLVGENAAVAGADPAQDFRVPRGAEADVVADAAVGAGIRRAVTDVGEGPVVFVNGLLLDERQALLGPGVSVPDVVLAAVGEDLERVLVVVAAEGELLE